MLPAVHVAGLRNAIEYDMSAKSLKMVERVIQVSKKLKHREHFLREGEFSVGEANRTLDVARKMIIRTEILEQANQTVSDRFLSSPVF